MAAYKVRLTIEKVLVEMEIDSGSAVSVCPSDVFNEHFSHIELKPVSMKLRTYTGGDVPVLGQAEVRVLYKNQNLVLPLLIVEVCRKDQPILLGRNWLAKLKLDWHAVFSRSYDTTGTKSKSTVNVTTCELKQSNCEVVLPNGKFEAEVEALKKKYNAVFQGGPGEIKGVKAQVTLKDNVVPKFCKFRPVPYSLREKVEQELDRWVEDGIAYRVSSSEWATPLVTVPKTNGVRLCADFKVTLNPVLQTEHYPLPQPEDIFASLSGCTYFSVVDLTNAYQQLAVAEDSQPLLTLTTHKGLFRLRRLPFGLSSAPAIFQAVVDQIINGLPGTVAYLDNVLVGGSTREEAFYRLEKLLQRLMEFGVQVNGSKCKFLQPEVEYLGYVISASGVSPQQGIVEAIQKDPEPTSKDELRAYVGLINYYGKFIQNLSAEIHCFYELLKKDVPWKWTEQCSQTFKESKSWVLCSDVLVHYDVLKPLVLTCDASPKGVSAILSHIINGEERPIAFASKTLSASEKNYSQLHKEALALIFGVKKFHKYIYGRTNCILQSDHQPLAAIFGSKRGVPSLAAARLQRWALILSAYNFEVKYRKGSSLPHADALSRLPLPENETLELDENYISHVESCVREMNFFNSGSDDSPITSLEIGQLTDKDPLLSKVRDFVLYGWREIVDPMLIPFQRRRDELSVDKNCILWGSRVVIPKKLQGKVIQILHEQHPGITRMKLLARSHVWWPGIEKVIEDAVSSCLICQSTRNAASKVPLQQWPLTSERWRRIHIDFAEDPTTRQQMLIVVDSFSKWMEVFLMGSISTGKTIEKLRTLFSAYGLPEELVCDNGTSFTSLEFREFLRKNGVKLTFSPPYRPASNGAAERSVQEVKKSLLRQVLGEKSSQQTSLQYKLDNFLFAYRNTPSSVTGVSPAELFLRWKPRTKLTMLKPNLLDESRKKQEMQKRASDRHRGACRFFNENQKVLVKTVRQEKVSWVPGRILQCKSPVTYLVSVLGKTRVCHADHLRPTEVEEDEIIVRKEEVGRTIEAHQQEFNRGLPILQESTSPSISRHDASPYLPRLKSGVGNPRGVQYSPSTVLRRSQRTVNKPEKLDL
ncbi:uncharacterized protein K02A2.6-like [Macrosteles quadrilineatus]|uniref:uncharacterized protein K02A2.6-like n=1 Tax=Macrosteles quadrilineatus TaxID=74068 RepID=UPI0023E326FD|nr:uncharacterized protein K02A2.6-like [Macrosteles quadrilineatus]